jgi:UDP-N-acetylglucosamine--N-acetylmuramyl-(pentapeptide) pyrophosphoryl-undecaprenol N-acetylglucosamine transferase
MKVLITGGGTGGHVFPAIAIANALRAIAPDTEVLFVGAKGKMEMQQVPKAGYAIEGLNIAGFQRRLTWKNLLFPFKLVDSLVRARIILRRFAPDVVIGTGGYASGPVMNVAQRMGIPTVIQEQNSYAGVTNKLLGKEAAVICVAYDGMQQFFPAEKIVFTGNPVRQDIVDLKGKRKEGLAYYGLDPAKKTIVVLGGSLGARSINAALRDNTALLAAHDNLQVLWQCGRIYEEEYKKCATAALPHVHLRAFIDRMDLLYAAADLIISRAGALSVSELCIVGRPALLVPSPNVAEDHQTKNALALVEKGAARMIHDHEATEKMLPEALAILENESVAFGLSESIRQLGRPNAAPTIAHLILSQRVQNFDPQ